MRNLKIKFFACSDSISAETPKLVNKNNKALQYVIDFPSENKITPALLSAISGVPGVYVFNPSYWILKTFYLTYGKYTDYITWLGCEHDSIWTIKDILFNIEN